MKDMFLGCFGTVVTLTALGLAIGGCLTGYMFYEQGFNEDTKWLAIIWSVTAFVWWVMASAYRTIRKGLRN